MTLATCLKFPVVVLFDNSSNSANQIDKIASHQLLPHALKIICDIRIISITYGLAGDIYY